MKLIEMYTSSWCEHHDYKKKGKKEKKRHDVSVNCSGTKQQLPYLVLVMGLLSSGRLVMGLCFISLFILSIRG